MEIEIPPKHETNIGSMSNEQDGEESPEYRDLAQVAFAYNDFYDEDASFHATALTYAEMLWETAVSAAPIGLQFVIPAGAFFLNTLFISMKADPNTVSAVGLGDSVFILSLFALMDGANWGIAVLVSQSFGAKDYKHCGIHYHRGIVVSYILYTFIALLICFSDKIFIYICHYDEEISMLTWHYLLYGLSPMTLMVFFNTTRTFLLGQSAYVGQFVITLIGEIFQVALAYYFIMVQDQENKTKALAIARIVGEAVKVIGVLIFCSCWDYFKETFFWPIKQSFHGIWKQFWYQIDLGSLQLLNHVGTELNILVAGFLTSEELAAQALAMKLFLVQTIPGSAIGRVTATKAAQCVGARKIEEARQYVICGAIVLTVCCCIVTLTSLLHIDYLAAFLTNDETVESHLKTALFWWALILPGESALVFQSIILRSLGEQRNSLKYLILLEFFVGFPYQVIVGLVYQFRLPGIIQGYLIAVCLLSVVYFFLYWKLDLEKRAEEIHQEKMLLAHAVEKDNNEIN